jgi:DNA modification methylase
MTSIIHHGDALAVLRTLPAESVHCLVTSPPYWRLRDYGVAGQYGLEDRVDCLGWATGQPCGDCFVCRLVAVFHEARRVLRGDGTAWVNMGDSYAANHGCKSNKSGAKQAQNRGSMSIDTRRNPIGVLKPKDLTGVPWRLALALQADGWFLRSDIIWHKPNPMPSSVKDRPTVAHEYLFLLAKSPRYFWDASAMQEPTAALADGARPQSPYSVSFDRPVAEPSRPGQSASQHRPGRTKVPGGWDTKPGAHGSVHREGRSAPQYVEGVADTRNRRSVWTIPTHPFPEAHYATFPPALVEPCLKAGCPAGGIVLDPFFGAGTTGLVARRLGRGFVGIELNPENCRMAKRRIERDTGLLGPVEIVAHGAAGQERKTA